jgi:hypothetical protein
MKPGLVGPGILAAAMFAAMLTGCGGSQPPIGPGAMPQTSALAAHGDRGKSWMLPKARGGELLYVTLPYGNEVDIFTFPQAKLVGTLTGLAFPLIVCSDKSGNVWVGDDQYSGSFTLEEFAHGGTSPIATLSGSNGTAEACAIDPTTGNLAVATDYYYERGDVDVYTDARGTPTIYTSDIYLPNSVTYDNVGDLFVAGNRNVYTAATDWLPKGASAISDFKLTPHIRPHTGIAWDGHDLLEIAYPDMIERYAVIGQKGEGIGSLTLDEPSVWAFVIRKSTLIASDASSNVYFFAYPSGGSPTYTIGGLDKPTGVAVSLAPH